MKCIPTLGWYVSVYHHEEISINQFLKFQIRLKVIHTFKEREKEINIVIIHR